MRENIEDFYPLSPLQEGMLFHAIELGLRGVYFDQTGYPIEGEVCPEALERAWNTVAARHPALRTSFVWKQTKQPIQVVQRCVELKIENIDWRGEARPDQRTLLEDRLRSDRERGFDLTQPPLMRLMLFRMGDREWYFNWSWHHLLMDGWSSALVVEEVSACYAAILRGEQPKLQPCRSYREFIRWLALRETDAAEAYWRNYLRDVQQPTPLAFDGPETEHGVPERSVKLPADVTASLQKCAREARVTLNSLVQGAWALLLSRYSGTPDVIFGSVVSGRPAELPGVETIVGVFINTLPVRVKVDGKQPAGEFLRQVQADQARSRQFEFTPLTAIQGVTAVPRHRPLFETIVAFENFRPNRGKSGGAEPAGAKVGAAHNSDRVNYPVALIAVPGPELVLQINYDPTRFSGASMTAALAHLQTILRGFSEGMNQALTSIPLVSAAERRAILELAAPVAPATPYFPSVWQSFVERAIAAPDAPAVMDSRGVTSYGQLLELAREYAAGLTGEAPGTVAALALPPSAESLGALLGVLGAGLDCLPLDVNAPSAWRERVCHEAGAAFVISSPHDRPRVVGGSGTAKPNHAGGAGMLWHSAGAICRTAEDTVLARLARLQHIAPLQTSDRVRMTSAADSFASVAETIWPLLSGACVVIEPLSGCDAAITVLQAPATRARALLAHRESLPGLRLILSPDGLAFTASEPPNPGAVRWLPLALLPEVYAERAAVLHASGQPAPEGIRGEVRVYAASGEFVPTGQFARPKGLEYRYEGHESRLVWNGACRIDLDLIERALLSLPDVEEAAVFLRRDTSGEDVIVAYVAAPASNIERIESGVSRLLPQFLRPSVCVPVLRLPLDACGGVDRETLFALPALEESVRVRWVEALRAAAPSGRASVVREPAGIEPARIPATALAPPVEQRQLQAAIVTAEAPASAPVSATHALVDGGPIQKPANCPETLAEMLCKAAAGGGGLVYLGPGGETGRQSYAELLHDARCALSLLRARGLCCGEPAILQFQDNRKFLTAFWACVLGGAIPVPTQFPTRYSLDDAACGRLAAAWQSLGRPVVLTDQDPDLVAGVLGADPGPLPRVWRTAPLALEEAPLSASAPEDSAFLLLTSGSTGAPKAVRHTHRGTVKWCCAKTQAFGFEANHISLNWMPLDHVGGLVYFHLRDVFLGALQLHAPSFAVLEDPLRWLDWIDQYRVTTTWAPSFAYALTAGRVAANPGRRWDLSSARWLFNGGEAVSVGAAAAFLQPLIAGHQLRRDVLRPDWGMSETCSGVTISPPLDPSQKGARVNLGKPIAGVAFRIVDENGRELCEGQEGALHVRGETMAFGYANNPEATAQSFRPDGWFDTGDVGLLLDGCLHITGRKKDIVIVNGVNYACQDIEAAVATVAAVDPSAVAAAGFKTCDAGEDLAVFVALRPGCDPALASAQIRAASALRAGVSPRVVLPLPADQIPRTSIGKIQKQELTRRLEAGAFDAILAGLEAADSACASVPDWFFKPVWHPSGLRAVASPDGVRDWILAGGDPAIADSLRAEIEAAGGVAFIAGDISELNPALLPCGQYGIVHLAFTGPESGDTSAAVRRTSEEMRNLSALVRLMQDAGKTPKRFVFVSSSAACVGEHENVAWYRAAVAGLLAVELEIQEVRCRWIDLPAIPTADDLRILAAELNARGPDGRIAIRDGKRYIQALEPVDLACEPILEPFTPGDDLVLITGGLGGIGRALAGDLVRQWNANILLVGRTPLEASSAKEWFEQLRRQSGGRVRYRVADVADRAALAAAVDAECAERGCRLGAVFHAAGAYEQMPLTETTPGAWKSVFDAKVFGAWNLHQLVAEHPGSWFVSFTSVHAIFAGFGASAYSAANSAVDAFADWQRANGMRRAYTIDWSMWPGVGMSGSKTLSAAAGQMGLLPVVPAEGLVSLWGILARNIHHVVAGINSAAPAIRRLCGASQEDVLTAYVSQAPSGIGRESVRDRFGVSAPCRMVQVPAEDFAPDGTIDPVKARIHSVVCSGARRELTTDTERRLAVIWRDILGLDLIGPEDTFFALGGHSLLAIRLLSRAGMEFGADLPLAFLFEHPSVAQMAAGLDSLLASQAPPPTPAIPKAPAGLLPLSFAQERLWVFERLAPGSPAYHLPIAFRWPGEVDVKALRRALDEIVRRHEVLRTALFERNGEPMQQTLPPESVPLELIDLSLADSASREESLERICEERFLRPFDLAGGRLLRGSLIRLAPRSHVLHLTTHHIAVDGLSVRILLDELEKLYRAFAAGKPTPLAEPTLQYPDFADWQRKTLAGAGLQERLEFWRTELSGVPALLTLPSDRPRSSTPRYRAATVPVVLNRDVSERLRRFCAEEELTPHMALLAAWGAFLARVTGMEDLVSASLDSGRARAELESLIGFFVNYVIVRNKDVGRVTFRELAHRTKDAYLQAHANSDAPLEQILEHCQVERFPGANPLFQTLFTLRNLDRKEPAGGAQAIAGDSASVSTTRFDLALTMTDGHPYRGELEYQTDLFDRSTAESLSRQFEALLDSALTDSAQAVMSLPLISPQERTQLLSSFERADWSQASPIHRMIERQASLTPNRTAVVHRARGLSYAEINGMANSLGHRLLACGVGKGSFVPLVCERGAEVLVGALAVLKTGAAFVPLDAGWPEQRLSDMVAQLGPAPVLLGSPGARVPGVAVTAIELDELGVDNVNPAIAVDLEDPIYAIFTSGSTGKPKAAIVPHRGITNRFLWMNEFFGRDTDDAVLQTTPHVYDSAVWQLMWPLTNGGCTVIPDAASVHDADALARLIERHRVTITDFVPSVLAELAPGLTQTGEARDRLRSLRCIVVGGESMDTASVSAIRDALPGLRVLNLYGPTEASIGCICYEVPAEIPARAPIGKPITNCRVVLLDPNRQLTPFGGQGELYLGGDCVGLGYLGDPAKTSEVFLPNPFPELGCATLYKTGDMARYLPDGNLDCLGRSDDQVKLRGVRIELSEIESAMLRHPGVARAVAAVRRNSKGDPYLAGYYIPLQEVELSEEELRTFLAEILPAALVPGALACLETVPLTASGKLDRKALPDPVPVLAEVAAPRNVTEARLLDCWREAFGERAIGIHDDFFQLGGHSLMAIRLMTRVQRVLGISLPIASLFADRTVAAQAERILSRGAAEQSPLVAIRPAGEKPPFFCVHPIGGQALIYEALASKLPAGRPFYGLQAPDLLSPPAPGVTIESMAREYVAAVRQIQPSGPYYVGGYSFGGVVAFEMARQFEQAAAEVAALVIIDTWSTIEWARIPEEQGSDPLQLLFRNRLREEGRSEIVGLPDPSEHPEEKRYTIVFRELKKQGIVGPHFPDELGAECVRNYVTGYQARHQAFKAYRPGPYYGPVTLIRTDGDPALDAVMRRFCIDTTDETMGWDRVAFAPVSVRRVSGTHERLCREPYVDGLADALAAALEEAAQEVLLQPHAVGF